ncbi:CdaR family protein [Virgibacillus sp. YIM 98842]|jgi:YbbR domain-containing protein|uniref:CdaR family protein n=1 Tax=Virgibacillus sp. YIM 98842 TaxID=2663533 RepID=UPI0013DACD3B|nr:CdaR family protein [Virgibacillus sp. YIM 98842]
MDNWFKSKWFVRALSLVFAVLLYVFVSVESNDTENTDLTFLPGSPSDTQTLNDVPVDIRMDDENYVVSGVPEHVTVTMEGSVGVLTPTVRQRNFDVFVDLEGLGEGEHRVELEHDITPDLSVDIEPPAIEVTIEERATAEFTVDVDFMNENDLPDGFEIGDYEVNPSSVSITSSRSVIDQIGIVKVYVNVANLDRPIEDREVPVNVYDNQGNELSVNIEPENVAVSLNVNNPSATVPLEVETTGELPDGFSLTSISANVDEVEIFATSELLGGIESIATEEIDLSEITESGIVDVPLALPEGVLAPEMETVEVTIELEETRTMDDIPIDVEALGNGQELSFIEPDEPEMGITAIGEQASMSEFDEEDIRLFINLEDVEAGEHTVPITIEGPEDITIDGEYEEATVEISDE